MWGLAPSVSGLRDRPADRVVPGMISESGQGKDSGLALEIGYTARKARAGCKGWSR